MYSKVSQTCIKCLGGVHLPNREKLLLVVYDLDLNQIVIQCGKSVCSHDYACVLN